jgi:hypothetical protein
MRPHYIRRAVRAIAALGAGVLAAVGFAFAGAASASTVAAPRSARAATFASRLRLRVRAVSAHDALTAPLDLPERRRARTPAARRRARGSRRSRTQIVMLHRDVLVGGDVVFIGHTRPHTERRLVGVDRRLGSRWVEVARARTDTGGRFLARYWPHTLGTVMLRLRLVGGGAPVATVTEPAATVFHRVVVSWYGPGGTTACGEVLGAGTLGVASPTLPCGTMVTLRNGARSVRVPVIDRGPYVAGRDYDLTYATKLALGAGDVSVLWASA